MSTAANILLAVADRTEAVVVAVAAADCAVEAEQRMEPIRN